MAMMKIAPPWITYVSELEQLFKYDRDVHVVYDNDEKRVCLYVDSTTKADALMNALPGEKVWGGVTLKIAVIPANDAEATVDRGSIFANIFAGNDAFSFIKTIRGIFSNNLTYVVFKNRVVQYFNDDLGDIYGNCSTLYQEIAKNVFGDQPGVFFCTDVESPADEQRWLTMSARRPEWP